MGCSNSKIEDEEAVSRCRQQKQFVKQAIKYRNAFAAAHASYLQSLRDVGIAFGQLAESELQKPNHLSSATVVRHVSLPTLRPLPPPPSFRTTSPTTLDLPRSRTLPLTVTKKKVLSEKNMPSPSKVTISPPKVVLSPPNVVLSPPKLALSPPKLALSPPKLVLPPLKVSPPKVLSPPITPGNKLEDPKIEANLSDKKSPLNLRKNGQTPLQPIDPDSPPSPPDANYGWDWFDLFQPPPMPIHLQEQRRYKHMRGEEQLDQVVDDELPFVEVEELHTEKDQIHEVKVLKKQEEEETEQHEIQKVQMQEPREETKGKKEQVAEPKIEEEMEMETTDSESSSEHSSESKVEGHEEETAIVLHEPKNLLEVLREIEEEFLKAAESGKDVSCMLEASKTRSNSAFLDSKGLSEHSTRLLRGLSWSNRSPGAPVSWAGLESSEDSTTEECGMFGSHASTLDRLYAWEKKLYEEVKALEYINIEFEKKRRLLRHLDAKGDSYEKVEKTRAATKALENQMMVSIQAMEATSSSIKRVTDDEMHPQLLKLLEELTKMWRAMFECHRKQKDALLMTQIPEGLLGESTSGFQRHTLMQLETTLSNWHLVFSSVFSAQTAYIDSVHSWLKLSLLKPDRESKFKASLAKRVNPPMCQLCEDWKGALDSLKDKLAIEAIKKFVDIVRNIIRQQIEEPKNQKTAEILLKDLPKRTSFSNNSENSHFETLELKRRLLAERHDSVEIHQEKFEQKDSISATPDGHMFSLKSLQDGLPELFQALSEFARLCMQTYEGILSKVKNQKEETVNN
ncbi:hypothetical protein O6H91_04G091200 [Diphasiastrum complanatum]|uniref:Uncharacterized protein n=2 Tax=Diphasiastrum complanatum TaxID=34168 RepID=A0ACC2DZ40_DIPCM|nr:hypothetical protein O6H91_04G091200 [Diphasiastrum complanatum]KAJ7559561.1 hypothetical protein O6H91_04G091200 [Diphasiastrum complanatum]